jgi:hypothetical protein
MRHPDHIPGCRRRTAARPCLAALALLAAGGCSPMRYSVDHVMVPLLENSREAAFLSDDIQTFRDASPSNLFLLEGMINTSPDNPDLRLTAAMLYFSYAFAFVEDRDEEYASLLYRKGRDHAYAVLVRNRAVPADPGVPFSEFEGRLPDLRPRDAEAAVWAAVNWAQHIGLHLDETSVMRDIPKATGLLERAAELDPGYFAGLSFVTIGSLESFKPPLMGGDPEASAAAFERAFALGGNSFLLARYFYARFYAYRMLDDVLFAETLEGVIDAELPDDDPYRLLNLIAKDKARSLLKEKDDLF